MATDRAGLLAEVSGMLHEMGRQMRGLLASRMSELDVSPPMAGALHMLGDPLPMHTLAERLSCDASYITGIADRLEERGLAERLPDPDDRRVRMLALTDAGRAMRDRLHSRIIDPNPLLDRLDDAELDHFAALLGKALGR